MEVEAIGVASIATQSGFDVLSTTGQSPVSIVQSPESWARDLLVGSDGVLRYGLIFLLAAVPLLEILVVIPLGIGLGSRPELVALAAFLGNVLPIYGIIAGHQRIEAFLQRRRESETQSSRHNRAIQIWDTYGLPGLAIASPISTGVHLAALLALGLGSTRRSTAVWMTVSIAIWTVVITVSSVSALSTIQALL
jgi:hypothetical protein